VTNKPLGGGVELREVLARRQRQIVQTTHTFKNNTCHLLGNFKKEKKIINKMDLNERDIDDST
jgi:hypothetical protein